MRLPLLVDHPCWFGGGTAIMLGHGEFHGSVDIDFLVSDQQSYRAVRQIFRNRGPDALATRALAQCRTPSVDGYEIRGSALVAGVMINVEIVHEGRIDLDTTSPDDVTCGVRTLTPTDQVASTPIANDDRWADTSTFNRDLIDLAMMRPDTPALEGGVRKAVGAYGRRWARAATGPSPICASDHATRGVSPRTSARRAASLCRQNIRDLAARCSRFDAVGPFVVRPPSAPRG